MQTRSPVGAIQKGSKGARKKKSWNLKPIEKNKHDLGKLIKSTKKTEIDFLVVMHSKLLLFFPKYPGEGSIASNYETSLKFQNRIVSRPQKRTEKCLREGYHDKFHLMRLGMWSDGRGGRMPD